TIDGTNYRREKQTSYNLEHNQVPKALNKSLDNALSSNSVATYAQEKAERKAAEEATRYLTKPQIEQKVRDTRKAMEKAAKELDFIEAARLRDEIKILQEQL
ncbi:MAG: UvrB/UvrC motif-containing protein, partial [Flavobacteriaceae bacterium]